MEIARAARRLCQQKPYQVKGEQYPSVLSIKGESGFVSRRLLFSQVL